MKKIYLSISMLLTMCLTTFAVQPELTDLPSAYGEQLWNSTFDGAWETTNNEPVNVSNGGGWHSFNTASTTALTTSAKSSAQMGSSSKLRPEASGSGKSARISSRNVMLGIIANGNITTGKINAGSMTAGNLASNYNRTVRAEEAYRTPFESKPDSVAVWINFKPVAATQLGRISIFIHGDGVDFQDPPATPASQNAAVAFAGQEYEKTNGEWLRLSVPFNYESYTSFSSFSNVNASTTTKQYDIPGNVEPKYIVVTMATNRVPGGTAGDTLWIDDFLMIYKPTLAVENTSGKSVFKSGEMLSVAYTITGTMSPYNLNADANVVSLELSDASGSFDEPVVLDYATTNASGVFTVELPESLEAGAYKLRVVTTNYPMISEEMDITIDDLSTSLKTIENTVAVYPNPVSTTLFVEGIDAENAVIYTLSGVKVAEVKVTESGINVADYAKGSYIIAIETKDGNVYKSLFVKE